MSVANAAYRDCQVPMSYTASAAQVSVSALQRNYGVGSLTHRAGTASAYGTALQRGVHGVSGRRTLRTPAARPFGLTRLPHCPQCCQSLR